MIDFPRSSSAQSSRFLGELPLRLAPARMKGMKPIQFLALLFPGELKTLFLLYKRKV
ncbi:hypothetical protein D3C77_654260 [compost metagenome]